MPSWSPSSSAVPSAGRYRLVDLDQRPELISATVNAFRTHLPGKQHLVSGFPWRMGLLPEAADLTACTGVLVACTAIEFLGAIAICPYSDEQVTLWGPAVTGEVATHPIARELLAQARRHLRRAGFTSVRLLVDGRNRDLRRFALDQGFTWWKDNHVYGRPLHRRTEPSPVREALSSERRTAARLLSAAFPDSDQARDFAHGRDLGAARIYVIEAGAVIVGAAVVDGPGTRGWLKLIAVAERSRGQGLGRTLLEGVCRREADRGTTRLGLEVLADNEAANALYLQLGFVREWSAAIMTGPV